MKNAKHYLIYSRKSRADNPNESVEDVLAKHEADLQELAIKLFGEPIPEENIYRELVSGETISDRPEVQKVLSIVESPRIEGVLCIEPQRLSRGDWEDGGKILSTFKYSNTLIITPTKQYNLQDQNDYRLFKMFLSQGNDYLEYFKEITVRGKNASVKAGNFIGNVAPYGYDRVKNGKHHTLAPNKDAETVKLIFHLFVNENLGWARIAHRLDDLGIKPMKKDYWNPVSIRDILMNPTYTGKLRWNWRKSVKTYENGQIKKSRPRQTEYILVDGLHEAIISQELFDKAQAKLGQNTKEKINTTLQNPFASLLVCKKCGSSLIMRTYRKDGLERCRPRVLCRNQTNCHTKSMVYDDLMDTVVETLERYIEEFEVKLTNEKERQTADFYTRRVEELEKELAKLEETQEELYDLLESKIYTREVFNTRNAKLASKRNTLHKQLEKAKSVVPERIDYEEKIYTFSQALAALKNDKVSAKAKNDFLKAIIEKIVYSNIESDRENRFESDIHLQIYLK